MSLAEVDLGLCQCRGRCAGDLGKSLFQFGVCANQSALKVAISRLLARRHGGLDAWPAALFPLP